MGYGEVDRIAKAVPNQLGIKLEEALQSEPLKEMYATDPTVHKLLDLAQQVEGVARNASTHAAGVVISREPLTELMPLQKATNSEFAHDPVRDARRGGARACSSSTSWASRT